MTTLHCARHASTFLSDRHLRAKNLRVEDAAQPLTEGLRRISQRHVFAWFCRHVIAVLVVVAAIHSCPAEARLGETVPELTKRFGRPYEQTASDGGRTRYNFHERNFDLAVIVENNISVSETYYSYQPLQPNGEPPNNIVRGILQTNAPGAKWKDATPQGRREEAAFVTADGKYRAAVYLYLDNPDAEFTVSVCTTAYNAMIPPEGDSRRTTQTQEPQLDSPTPLPSADNAVAETQKGEKTQDQKSGTETADDEVYRDTEAERYYKMSPVDRHKALQSMPRAEHDRLIKKLYAYRVKGFDENGNPVAYTAAELEANAILYSQACNLAIRKQQELFIRQFVSNDPRGGADSFISVISWTGTIPRDHRLVEYKNVTFNVSVSPISDVDRMNGWRWRGEVTFAARYKRNFQANNGSSSDQGASSALHPLDWQPSGDFLSVSVDNRDDQWTTSVHQKEYSKPDASDVRAYDAAVKSDPRRK